MSYVRLSPEQQQAVCEDLLCIMQAARLPRLSAVRREMLREHRGASPWQLADADCLAKQAATFIGGTPGYWWQAAAAALGVSSRVDVSIEAAWQVAEDVRRHEQQEQESRRAAPRARLTIGSRKRGCR